MRSRQDIEQDGKRVDLKILEVLLDIRDGYAPLYVKEPKPEVKVKRKRRTKKEMELARAKGRKK